MSPHMMGIGETVSSLRAEFPDISVSKIRFLEAEGLVLPLRTPSGYRKYTAAHVERIGYVLRMQRDHYLPLKVIAEYLDAIDRGLTPPEPTSATPTADVVAAPTPDLDTRDTGVRLRRAELSRESGLSEVEVTTAIEAGLLPDTGQYTLDDVEVARSLHALSAAGLQVRNARQVGLAVQREVDLHTMALGQSRPGESPEDYEERSRSLAAALIRLHVAVMRTRI
ncbi:MAG: MerR family transcriptional regulator [Candidatus Nanopelagicales bacterium]